MNPETKDPDIAGLLMPGEEILLMASQSKVAPGGSISSPDRIYMTTSRVLFKDPKIFGLRANIIAIRYEDIATIMLKRGVFSTEILLKPRASLQHIDLPAVSKQMALQVSSLIQKGMRGELTSHKISPTKEEKIDEPKAAERPLREKPKIDVLNRLERLALMRHQGIITEEEFGIFKKELILDIKPQILGEPIVPIHQPEPSQHLPQKTDPSPIAEVQQQQAEKSREKGSIICRYCGYAEMQQLSEFCPDCGKNLKAETNVWKMCPTCDALTTNDAAFCPACRQKFSESLS
jgi:RNA polymerase subunit RPABC4/transcription elongation factor Spt4